MKFTALVLAVLLLCSPGFPQKKVPEHDAEELIFLNGNIYLEEGSTAQAMSIRDGRIVEVGTDAHIRKAAGPKARMVDLQGKFVMAGFNDAHLHLVNGGFEKLNVNLIGTKSLAEMRSRIAERAKTAPKGEWITGRGWDHTLWGIKDAPLPTREDIDQVTGNHPAVFGRVDGHIAVANSAALKAAGINRESKDPQGGKIDRGEVGEPTGILRETAMELVYGKVPPPSGEKRRHAAELALQDAAQWGITSAQDNSDWQDFLVYEQLERKGKLTLRITEWLPFTAPVADLEKMRTYHPQDDGMLHTGMLKGFMDGSLGSHTAALLAPYNDDPGNSGIPRYTQDQLDKLTTERAKAGFQIGFHAIGDRGVEMALKAFELGAQITSRPASSFRFRIEHDQVIAPAQFEKFKKLGVIASMQPSHLLTDMNWAETRLGKERAETSYAWHKFIEMGVPLAFGTDYPVEPITPFRGLYAAVTRKNEAGTKTYFPKEKLTIFEAIAAYTTGSAFAEFAEKVKGKLAPGMLADFIVLDRDITKVAPEEILKTKVLRTVVGGKTVYEAR